MPSIIRIPVPGTNGLFIEFSPRGYVPKTGSTSTVFIQDVAGKRHLRLDYGYNKTTNSFNYHWNQQGTAQVFGITNHSPAGNMGKALYNAAKVFKYAGRTLVIVGAVTDVYSIVVAKKRLRQVIKVASGWAGAALGTEVGGEFGAGVGTVIEPGGGTVVGGVVGGVIGGIGGYFGASWAAGQGYDYIEETYFEKVPEGG
ncbi:hypothetical protein [Hyalangium versicolor]|uniref:hypothetical protein n=1 Tax=Hyalangium versicolor TaxID=2861190 RepID=UPI001CCB8886|nr:hypothetical protein [Hyalangium versicolor]